MTTPRLKTALQKAMDLRTGLTDTQRELAQVEKQLKAITDDQVRLRANLEKMPQTSAAYKRYLEKFDNQETVIEKLQSQIQELQTRAATQRQECETYLSGLDLEATIRQRAKEE